MDRVPAGLHALGCHGCDTVAAMLRNGPEYVALVLACRQSGLCLASLNWHFKACTRNHILVDSGARALFVPEDLLPQRIADHAGNGRLRGVRHSGRRVGEALAAAVQLCPGCRIDAGEVQTYLRARIVNYKVPRVIEGHDALPREDTGKIFKRLLRAPHWQLSQRPLIWCPFAPSPVERISDEPAPHPLAAPAPSGHGVAALTTAAAPERVAETA